MFRFTIRDVLWLMVVTGMAAGWWLDHRKLETLIRVMDGQGYEVTGGFGALEVWRRNPPRKSGPDVTEDSN